MSLQNSAVTFRNISLAATLVVLREVEPPRLADALHKQLGGMPDFFNGEAALLDFSEIASRLPEQIDWAGLNSLLRRYQLQPVGVRHLPEPHHAAAKRAGLAILDQSGLTQRGAPPAPVPEPVAAPVAPVAAVLPPGGATMVVERPLRSGQQVYAKGGDLVLLAGVSPGAEVIADGSIHCYGALRGRALAGAQGMRSARIISTNFGPELVSIAGVFRTFERGIPEAVAGKAAQVQLSDAQQDASTLDLSPLRLG